MQIATYATTSDTVLSGLDGKNYYIASTTELIKANCLDTICIVISQIMHCCFNAFLIVDKYVFELISESDDKTKFKMLICGESGGEKQQPTRMGWLDFRQMLCNGRHLSKCSSRDLNQSGTHTKKNVFLLSFRGFFCKVWSFLLPELETSIWVVNWC